MRHWLLYRIVSIPNANDGKRKAYQDMLRKCNKQLNERWDTTKFGK
jgi:hypothetical protein